MLWTQLEELFLHRLYREKIRIIKSPRDFRHAQAYLQDWRGVASWGLLFFCLAQVMFSLTPSSGDSPLDLGVGEDIIWQERGDWWYHVKEWSSLKRNSFGGGETQGGNKSCVLNMWSVRCHLDTGGSLMVKSIAQGNLGPVR